MRALHHATPTRQLRHLLGYLLAILIAGAAPAMAAESAALGAVVHGHVDLAGKQIVLPAGDWIVAGRAAETLPALAGVPYGAIESLVLLRLADKPAKTVAAFVIARRNAIAITDGWGVAPECQRTDILLAVVYQDDEGHSYCGFVNHVLSAVDPESDPAWRQAVDYIRAHDLSVPETWLMAGFRLSDLRDVLDVRYNFNPDLQGIAPVPTTSWANSPWTRRRIFGEETSTGTPSVVSSLFNRIAFWRGPSTAAEPAAGPQAQARADLVNGLKDWVARMRYPVEFGFDNRAADLAPLPMPWTTSVDDPVPELAIRLATLSQLLDRHIISRVEYERQRAIAVGLSAAEAGNRWTAEELTVIKAITDQVSGSIGYFGSDLLYTGTITTASQIWGFDQFLDMVRYSAQEYLWQKLGPRKLGISEAVAFPGSGIDG
jgi:hypothetical protein